MSSEAAPPDPVAGQVAPTVGAEAAAAEAVASAGDVGPVVAETMRDDTGVPGTTSEGADDPGLGDPGAGDPGPGGDPGAGDPGAGGDPGATLGSPYEGSTAATPYEQLVHQTPAPYVSGYEGLAGQPVASLFEPIPVSEAGYVIDRPDVSQAVCTDHDVRRINLTALRPVAAAHPFPLVFSSVSGAHEYGFPSADSDVDLRGVHVLPANQVVGLRHGPQTVERTWLHDEVKLDLVTHDVGKFFRLMLRRNGHVLEQLLSPLVVTTSPVHEELVAIAGGCLTRGYAHHYRGAANEQWELYQQTGQLKPLLYTFRVLLTGIHVMRTGGLVTHLPTLLEVVPGAPGYLTELIEVKTAADQEYAPDQPERVSDDVITLQAELDVAEGDSQLPDHPVAEGALHDLLVRLRLESVPA